MTGHDYIYIALAGRLVASPALGSAEARFRTAASRAYYGAFHLAITLLAIWGLKVRQNAYGHQDVYNLFWGSGHEEARKVASLLDDLRTERIKADYRMDDPRFQTPQTAMMCVEMGEFVKSRLERCQSGAVVSRLGTRPAEESFNLENPVERLNRNRPRPEEVPPPVREALPVPQ